MARDTQRYIISAWNNSNTGYNFLHKAKLPQAGRNYLLIDYDVTTEDITHQSSLYLRGTDSVARFLKNQNSIHKSSTIKSRK